MTRATLVALLLAFGVAAVGVARNTWAVGGSDSSCYALMAQAFADGTRQPRSELAATAPWPRAGETFAPGGFLPSRSSRDAAVPICAPGFSLVLAPFRLVGGADAIFLVSPLAGALLVFAAFALGRTLAGEMAGLAGAVLVAVMPVLMFQLVQPMNDVFVAALWVAILAIAAQPRDHPGALGALTGLALLVRPNLAPAAVVVGVWAAGGGAFHLLRFAAAAVPFIGVLLALHTALYGHPLRTGYGSVEDLFAWAHVPDNVVNYGRALWATQLAFPVLGLFAIAAVSVPLRRVVLLCIAIAAAVSGVYLLYRPFPEWWYLRFLLPPLAVFTVLGVAWLRLAWRSAVLVVAVVAVLVTVSVRSAAMREAWTLEQHESRFRTAASVARERLPAGAVFFTVWESGSVRYHARREAILWDSLEPASLDAALDWLATQDRDSFLMIEDWEEPLFRERFAAASPSGQLDWPPRFDIERRVRIYRFADRDAYLAGANIPTEYVRRRR